MALVLTLTRWWRVCLCRHVKQQLAEAQTAVGRKDMEVSHFQVRPQTYSNVLQLHVCQWIHTSALGFGLFGCLVVASHPQARARASEEVAGSARSAKHEVEVLRSEVSELGLAVCLRGWGAAGLTCMHACCSCELYKSERANWIAR